MPVSLEVLTHAIKLNDVALEGNLLAFSLGRLAAAKPAALRTLRGTAEILPSDESIDTRIARGVTHLSGYYGQDNVAYLCERDIPALIADNAMSQRDERFKGQGKYKPKADVLHDKRASVHKVVWFKREHFSHDEASDSYTCPAGKTLTRAGNIRHNKGLNRFHLRGEAKERGQWHLFCLVHNIEKLARAGIGQAAKRVK